MPSLRWPLRVLPVPGAAGRFPHSDRDFGARYLGPSNAIHLYEYGGEMRLDDHAFSFAPGDLTITPAGVASRYHLPVPGHHWCIHFQAQSSGRESFVLPCHIRLGPRRDFVIDRMAGIARLGAQGSATGGTGEVAAAAASAALQELLLWLRLSTDAGGGTRGDGLDRGDAALERLAAIIAERFAEPLAVPDLARAVGMSQNHLARRFHQRFAMTIPRFLLARRIERARHLLQITDLPVNVVAASVGMPDPQHFNKQFRRLVGHSPSADRDKAERIRGDRSS